MMAWKLLCGIDSYHSQAFIKIVPMTFMLDFLNQTDKRFNETLAMEPSTTT